MTSPYYLFLDFDDTLFLHGKIHKKTLRALYKAKKAGCHIYINSGRSRGNLMTALKNATDFPFEAYLCGFACAYLGDNADKPIIRYTLDNEVVSHFIDYCIKYSYSATIESEEVPEYRMQIDEDVNYTDEDYAELSKKAHEFLEGKTPIKVNCWTQKKTGYFAENIAEENPDLKFIRNSTYYESYNEKYGKGVLMKEFAEKIGIDFNRCIHFGDSANDANGFEIAPIGVGMKKTPKEVQHLCSYVAKTEFGVAEYINKVLLKKIKQEKKALKYSAK